MLRLAEERKEELRTWELAKINSRVKDIIEDITEGVNSSINKQGIDLIKDIKENGTAEQRMSNMEVEGEELGSNEVEERHDKEIDNKADLEVDKLVHLEVNREAHLDDDKDVHLEETGSTGRAFSYSLSSPLIKAFVRFCSTEPVNTHSIPQVASWA